MLKLLYLVIFCALLSACADNSIPEATDRLVGGWTMQTSTINGVNTDTYFHYYEGHWMTFYADHTYMSHDLPYQLAQWRVEGYILVLAMPGKHNRSFRILDLTTEQLTIEYKTTEQAIGLDLPGIEQEEVLTFREVYNRVHIK